MSDEKSKIDAISPISKRLREARVDFGISQKDLGIRAGIDKFVASARINQYEQGKHTPGYSTVKLLAKVLDMPVPFFYTENELLASLIKKLHQLPKNEFVKQVNKINNSLDK